MSVESNSGGLNTIDKRVYLLTVISFVVGLVELIIGGILDVIATDLEVSLGQAGLLISIFALIFALSAPILLILTAKIERTRLTLLSLTVFLFGNMIAIMSTSYSLLMISRIVSAASGSLLIVLCMTLASNIVKPAFHGRALGLVIMGISGSLVLGVPIGVMLGHAYGWRSPFILIAILTLLLMICVRLFMGKVTPNPPIPLRKQIVTLKNKTILFTQLTTFFFLAGHFTLYGYLTPFAKSLLHFDEKWITVMYLLYGISAVTGGGIGGMSTDRFGSKKTIIAAIISLSICLFSIPHLTFALPLFLVVLMVWGMLSWTITPPIQTYLIQQAPEMSDIQQSLNNSALHFGIAFGTLVGSFVIEQSTVKANAVVGGGILLLALFTATLAMHTEKNRSHFPRSVN